MGMVVAALFIINVIFIWAYVYFRPELLNYKALNVFDKCTFGVAIMLGSVAAFNIFARFDTANAADKNQELGLALIYAFAVSAAVFFCMFLIRNFFIFRARNNDIY